jgi:hypothetical protein
VISTSTSTSTSTSLATTPSVICLLQKIKIIYVTRKMTVKDDYTMNNLLRIVIKILL